MRLRVLIYFMLTIHQFLYQNGALHKAIFALICCFIAEYFYSRYKDIFYTIIFYRFFILFINTVIPLALWDEVFQLNFMDYSTRVNIHYFKEEYLLSYQLYFLYTAVHVNAISYAALKKFVPFNIIFLLSIMLFLAVSSSFGRNPIEGYPNGFLDDTFFRSFLHIGAVCTVFIFYLGIIGKKLHLKPDPKQFTLLFLYLIYNLMMIAENIYNVNDFSAYTYTFPFILLIAYAVLRASQRKLTHILLDNRIKNIVIGISVILFFVEDFPVYKLIWAIFAVSFFYIRVYTNKIEKKSDYYK